MLLAFLLLGEPHRYVVQPLHCTTLVEMNVARLIKLDKPGIVTGKMGSCAKFTAAPSTGSNKTEH